jgi:hypothetical protein
MADGGVCRYKLWYTYVVPTPTRQQVLVFYDAQPESDRTTNGFVKGSDSRAAFIEWYLNSLDTADVVSPSGVGHAGPEEVRAYALYVLERSVKARRKKESPALQVPLSCPLPE